LVACLAASHSALFLLAQEPAAQQARSAAENQPKRLPSTATLPADYPVITLPGLCPAASSGTKTAPSQRDCKTVVTRAAFEKLVNAIDPAMSKFERQELAQAYGQNIILAQRAVERGLEKEPRVQELLRYSRLRILASELSQEVFRESTRVSPEEVARFYAENKPVFEKFTLQRIFIPREKQGGPEESDGQPASSPEAAMKALAETIHTRAVAGEDFEKLQQEVFDAAGMTGKADTKMADVTRESLPDLHKPVLDLATGAVSPLFSDSNGYYVYKVLAREVPPLEGVKQQAELRLERKKSFDTLDQIRKSAKAEINDAYFDKYDPPAPNPGEREVEND
jgi:hypothetical protein